MTGIIAYFAKNHEDMDYLREHPEAVNTAAEEFFRLAIPLTHIGRVCPAKTEMQGFTVAAGGRISLTWAAANRDPEAFENPNEVNLERKPNPHVAFGFGPQTVSAPTTPAPSCAASSSSYRGWFQK